MGRTAFVFLSRGQRGETDFALWRGARAAYAVALQATAPSKEDRYPNVAAFVHAWREVANLVSTSSLPR
jgi:hypothetical protein